MTLLALVLLAILLWSALLFHLARRGLGWLAAGLGLASLVLWVVFPLSALLTGVPFVWACALAGGGLALLLMRGGRVRPVWLAGCALVPLGAAAMLAGIGPAAGRPALFIVPVVLLILIPALFGGLIGAGWGLWLRERDEAER